MKILTKTSIFVIIVLISGVVASYFTVKKMKKNEKNNSANVILYNLATELDLYELWESKYKTDQTFETSIKHLIYDKILSLSVIKPTLNELDGLPIAALGRLIEISKSKNFKFEQYENAYKKSITYLYSIEKEVQDVLKKRKALYQNELERLQH